MFGDFRDILKSLAVLAAVLAANTFLFGQAIDNHKIVLIYVVTNLAFIGLARGQRCEASRRDGWHYLTVSLAQWLVAAALVGMTGLFLYVFLFVGSARHDAASQMVALQYLIAGFGAMSGIMAWVTFSSFTRWNGDGIEQDIIFFGRRAIRFGDIAEVRYEMWSDSLRIAGMDSAVIRIPRMHNGAHALAEELAHRLGVALPGPAGDNAER